MWLQVSGPTVGHSLHCATGGGPFGFPMAPSVAGSSSLSRRRAQPRGAAPAGTARTLVGMALTDLTRCFTSARVDWTLTGQAFVAQFKEHARVARGVYAHLDTNASELPIYDDNGPGKVIILRQATALKFGKFEDPLPGRMRENYRHFHRRPEEGPPETGIFPEVLACLIVLDLSHRPREAIRGIETQWNRSIRAALEAQGLVHPEHRGRSESINLRRALTREELLAILRPIANRVDPPAGPGG